MVIDGQVHTRSKTLFNWNIVYMYMVYKKLIQPASRTHNGESFCLKYSCLQGQNL